MPASGGPVRLLKDAAKAYIDRAGVPYGKRFAMVRRGFIGEAYVYYEFDRNDPKDYLPNDIWAPLHRVNGPAVTTLLANKLLFWHAFSDELPVPPVLALVSQGHVMPVAERGMTSPAAVLASLDSGPLILKPMDGQKGKRIHLLSASDGQLFLDGHPTSEADAERAIIERDGTLIVGYAEQAEYARRIFPGSANTVRVVTFGGEGTGYEPFVSATAHRFGTKASAPVDNMSSGGVMGRVDPETHVMGRVCAFPFGADRLEWHDAHPDTGEQVAGVRVPGLGRVIERLTAFMREHPSFAYVGWDVVITDDGFLLLEANYGAGIQTQMFGFPYRRDERVMSFLRHHGLTDRLKG